MFDYKEKIAVVTGGGRGIGKCISEKFREAGATVCVIDLLDNDYFVGDLADKETLERFAEKVISEYGHVDYLINNAAPLSRGITEATYEWKKCILPCLPMEKSKRVKTEYRMMMYIAV